MGDEIGGAIGGAIGADESTSSQFGVFRVREADDSERKILDQRHDLRAFFTNRLREIHP